VSLAALVAIGACTDEAGEQGTGGAGGDPGTPDAGVGAEAFGLTGTVTEANGELVPSGIVYLVPASEVEELAQTPIDLFASPQDTAMLAVDEPIEDLLDANAERYEQADVDVDGAYRFETLPEGRHFVVWVPHDDDARHLPGGDSSRVSFDSDSLIGMQMDIRVSPQPSASARYLGSSACTGCHGLESTTRTAHNVGLQVPGVRSPLQDVEPWPDFDEGLQAFEGPGTTLYYYDCNPGVAEPAKCSVADSPPAGAVAFTINLRRDAMKPVGELGAYYVEMVDGSVERYDVVLTYGGALQRQQYLTRRTNADGSFSYFVLPVQYNYQGDSGNPDPADWPWRDYRSDLWYDFGADTLRQPNNADSFDNNCAGCHFTGYELRSVTGAGGAGGAGGNGGSDVEGWAASAVVDAGGSFDYDGDGRVELINVGCESCHGPGSDHLMPSANGRHIASPGLLTPGRQAALCGSCHSRPLGIGGGERGLPLSEENEMPPPGIRRAAFAVNHTTRVSGDPDEDFFDSGDAFGNYQQYSDHIRSKHYRNPSRLLTCTNCHSPHANSADIAAMDTSGDDNTLCTTCHSPAVTPELYPLTDHVAEVTGGSVHDDRGPFLCTECHMVPTARSGASLPALEDPPKQYYWNDIASHRMSMTRRAAFPGQPDQPIAFTNQCGFPCHGNFLPN